MVKRFNNAIQRAAAFALVVALFAGRSARAAGDEASASTPTNAPVEKTGKAASAAVAAAKTETASAPQMTDTEALTSSSGKSSSPSPASPGSGLSPAVHGVLPEVLSSNNPAAAPVEGFGSLPLPASIKPEPAKTPTNEVADFESQLDFARMMRTNRSPMEANRVLGLLMESKAPLTIKKPALIELALVAQDNNELTRALQVFAQYLHSYPDDANGPEILLREGLIYRQMGVMTLAISKFYGVMSTALNLKLDNIDYYKRLVLQAQVEIADTYYMQGKYEESADFFTRLIKTSAGQLNRAQIEYKLVRSLSFMTNHAETIAKAQTFLEINSKAKEVPEVRYMLASTLKKIGRNQEAMKQVLQLLRSQQDNVDKNPEMWIYWQQKAGNDIANQLYKEGDYLNALQIYLSLADLDKTPAWQMPVWYQSALVYEQLQQPLKAREMYTRIIQRQKDLTEATTTPSLTSLYEMAKWRIDYLDWAEKAKLAGQVYAPTKPPAEPRTTSAP